MSRFFLCIGLIAVPQLFAQQIFQCPNASVTVAEGINNAGTIVGHYNLIQGGAHAFIYSGGVCTTIDVPNATNTEAMAINDAGTVSGFYTDTNGFFHGFLRSSGGTLTVLDFPTITSNTLSFDINSGGTSITEDVNGTVFLHSGSTFTQVMMSHPLTTYLKLGINDALNVIVGTVGSSQNPGCFIDAYPSGASTPFSVPGSTLTHCFDINNAGTIAGTYFTADGLQFAFVRAGTTIRTLPNLTGASANGLNDMGQVVGSFTTNSGATAAFIMTVNITAGGAAPGDFDANGVPDVVLQFPDGSAGIWYMASSGRQLSISSFAFFAGASSGITVSDISDLNRDGVPDVILRFTDGSIGVWYMGGPNGTVIQNFAFIAGPIPAWSPVGMADMNGDGHPDMIIQNTDGSTGIWYLIGNQIQGFAPIGGPIAGWKVVGVGDLNNDGHPDLIIQYTDGSVGVWFMGGSLSNQIQTFTLIAGPSTWKVVGVADMDADGQPDLAIRNSDGTLAVWYLGGAQGAQVQAFAPISGPGNTNWLEMTTH